MISVKASLQKPVSIFLFAGFLFLLNALPYAANAQRRKKEKTEQSTSVDILQTDSIEDADNIFARALQQKAAGNYDEALNSFRKFATLKPNNATAHYEIAKILYLEKYDIKKALDEAELASRLEPDNKWMKEFYADMLAISEKKDEASAIYKDLSDKEALSQDYLIKQILLYLDDEKYDEALEAVNKLNHSNGFDEETVLQMKYDIFIRQKKFDSAIAIAQNLMIIDDSEPRYAVMLANVYENKNDSIKAEEILTTVAKKYPDNAEAQFALLEYYLSKKNIEKGADVFGKAISNKNISNEGKNYLLSIFTISSMADSNALKRIKTELDKAAAIQPVDTHVVRLYAEFLYLSDDRDDAAIQYKKLLQYDTTEKETWNAILLIYAQQNNGDSLLAYSKRALAMYPDNINFNYMTAIGYQLNKEYSASLPLMEKSIELHEDGNDYFVPLSQMYSSLADAYYFSKKYKESDKAYDNALKLEPDNASALNNYSYYLSERGERLEDAEKMSAKSLLLRPDEATFLDTYGWIMYKQGNYKKAKKYIEKAISLTIKEEMDGSLYEHLGDIELKLGNRKSAIENWKKAQGFPGVSDTIVQKLNDNN